jgi:predicted nucleotidyltransferase
MAVSEGARWLDKAREHLKMASLALEGGIYSLSCFNAQQAAEQAFLDALKDRPITALLFGSRAQGTATPLSDHDLLGVYGDAPVAAPLTGRIVLDNLGITSRLARLIEDLNRRGARVEADRILLPRRDR